MELKLEWNVAGELAPGRSASERYLLIYDILFELLYNILLETLES